MKRLIAAGMLLAVVIAVCIMGNITTSAVKRNAALMLNNCKKAIAEEKTAEAAEAADELKEYWNSKRIILSFFVNHSRYEDAAAAIEKIHAELESGDIESALTDCGEVYLLLREIELEQQLRIDHIF